MEVTADGDDWLSVTNGLIFASLLLLVIWFWRVWRQTKTFVGIGMPGPAPLPFVGNTVPLMRQGLLTMLQKWQQQYGKIYGAFIPLPTVVVTDPEAVRDIMVKHFSAFHNRGLHEVGPSAAVTYYWVRTALQNRQRMMDYPPWRRSIFVLRDDHWKYVRSQLSPTFSSGKLKKLFPAIERVNTNLQRNLQQIVEQEQPVELRSLAGCFAIDVIAGAAFGIQVDSLQNPHDDFVRHASGTFTRMEKLFPVYVAFPWLAPVLIKLGLTIPAPASNNFYLSILTAALKDRRMENRKYVDFLQLLVDAEKEGEEEKQVVDVEIDHTDQLTTSTQWNRKGLSQEEIFGNALIFLFAGYDTTSNALAFTLFSLAANESCLQKALREVDEKVGQNQVNYEMANELTYLDLCINETLRLYPPVAFIDRTAACDFDLRGYHVPEGMTLIIPLFLLHYDPDLWTDPQKYDPERHTPEARAARHPCAFLPFGLGPRNCIGMRLAQVEIRVALAGILQRYIPVLCDKSVYPPRFKSFNRFDADDGLWVKFRPRHK